MIVHRPGTSRGARLLSGAVVLLTAAFAASTVVPGLRPGGGPTPAWDLWVYCAISLGAAGLCLLRAATSVEERLPWLALGLGLAASAGGDIAYGVQSAQGGSVPYPSAADPLFLAFYPLAYLGLVLLVRGRMNRLTPSMWLDGLGAGLALSALVTAVLLQGILASADGQLLGVLVTLAYPIADVLLVLVIAGAFGLMGWRADRRWLLLGGGLLAWALADSVYLHQTARDTYVEGTPLDVLWPLGALSIGLAAWQPPQHGARVLRDWMAIAVPSACTLLALGVLVSQATAGAEHLAVGLAAGAVCASVGRTFLTFAEVRRLSAQAERAASTDELTGLPNRRALMPRLEAAVGAGEPLALLLIDLDGFKAVNDTHGHAAGDAVLREVGPRLRASVRDLDVAGRLGGDEFAVVLPAPVDLAVAGQVAERMTAALERPFHVAGGTVHIGASVGMAVHPEDAPDVSGLLRRADQRMYLDKRERHGEAVPMALAEPVGPTS